jgi:hypothetical protein
MCNGDGGLRSRNQTNKQTQARKQRHGRASARARTGRLPGRPNPTQFDPNLLFLFPNLNPNLYPSVLQ